MCTSIMGTPGMAHQFGSAFGQHDGWGAAHGPGFEMGLREMCHEWRTLHNPSSGTAAATSSASQDPASDPSSSSSASDSGAQAFIDAINRARADAGLLPVQELPSLDSAAASNDRANVATGQDEHHNGLINGSNGEITAMAGSGETPAGAVQQWLEDPEHRAILLSPDVKYVGVDINGIYATADFS